MTILGTFTAGEDIAIAIDVASGTAPAGLVVTASLILGRLSGRSFTPRRGAQPIALTVTPRAAAGLVPAGWNVTLSASASADLEPGVYAAFGRYQDGDAVTIDDVPAVIRVNAGLPA